MERFTREDAISRVKSFKQPVDEGVYDSLINFMVIADRLNSVTTESCHGHTDWIFAYPNISFKVRHPPQRRRPFWRIFEVYKRYKNRKIIESTLEKRVENIVFYLTREIILFHQNDKTDPRLQFTVIRVNEFGFRIISAFPNYSRGLRNAGMFDELERLLVEHREVLKRLSEHLLDRIELLTSLDGENRCDCDVCRIKQ